MVTPKEILSVLDNALFGQRETKSTNAECTRLRNECVTAFGETFTRTLQRQNLFSKKSQIASFKSALANKAGAPATVAKDETKITNEPKTAMNHQSNFTVVTRKPAHETAFKNAAGRTQAEIGSATTAMATVLRSPEGRGYSAKADSVLSQLALHIPKAEVEVLEIYGAASGDKDKFLRRALQQAEEATARAGVQAQQRVAANRIEQRRVAAKVGAPAPAWSVAELAAMASTVDLPGSNLSHELKYAEDDAARLSKLTKFFHGARLDVPGLDFSAVKVSASDQPTMETKRQVSAQTAISDWVATVNGTQSIARFDSLGARAARGFMSDATGQAKV